MWEIWEITYNSTKRTIFAPRYNLNFFLAICIFFIGILHSSYTPYRLRNQSLANFLEMRTPKPCLGSSAYCKGLPHPLPMLAWWVITPHHVAHNLKHLFHKHFNGYNAISKKNCLILPKNLTVWRWYKDNWRDYAFVTEFLFNSNSTPTCPGLPMGGYFWNAQWNQQQDRSFSTYALGTG